MLSIYRIFGGVGLFLFGLTMLPIGVSHPVLTVIIAICFLVAGIALLAGM